MTKATLKKIGAWIVFVVLGLFYIQMGLMKFIVSGWTERFASWGYPVYFQYVIGVLELLSGIGLFVPRVRAYAAAALTLVMLGALATHLIYWEQPNIVVTLTLSLIMASITYAHRHKLVWRRKEPAASL